MYKRLLAAVLLVLSKAAAQVPDFLQWTGSVSQTQLAARASVIQGITTVAAAETHKAQIRAKMLSLLPGMPTYAGPLNAQVTGTIDRGTFRIEKILFESMPGIRVSGNLYIPQGIGIGPFPAILDQVGHFENGKADQQLIASNLALKGFVVFAFDPLGEGERLQGYNTATGTSIAPWGTSQHWLAGSQAALVGGNFAAYEIFDAKRALDYLLTRAEVDANRIGATGCSGGGTLTSFLVSLDTRIQVAAPSCSTNTFAYIMPNLIGDSEQSWPNYISSGLDQMDHIEAFAPKPYLILATQNDYAPPGTVAAYNEAKQWYSIYGVPNQVSLYVGPGDHGTPIEDRQQLYAWMIQWLKAGVGDATEQTVTLVPDSQLQVTAANYVGGSDIYTVIRQSASQSGSAQDLNDFLRNAIQYAPQSSGPAFGTITDMGSYLREPFTFSPEPGVTISAQFLLPKIAAPQPVAIYFETDGVNSAAAIQLAMSGVAVLDILPRALPVVDSDPFVLEWMPAEAAWLIGRNLPGMRAKDLLQGLDLLLALPGVSQTDISLYANGVHGITALYAAAFDQRIATVVLNGTPYSFAPALNAPAHYSLHSVIIPGFAARFDVSSLVLALGRRKLLWSNPTDWYGTAVSNQATTPRLNATVAGHGVLGSQYYVDLAVTNAGPGSALSTSLTALTARTLSGTGVSSIVSPTPFPVGSLPAGASQTVRILLNVPATVTRFSLAESGTIVNDVGASLTFSFSQAIIR